MAIYVPLFRTGSSEDLIKFVTIFNNNIQGQDLSTGPQKFGMMRNLGIREALQVFENKARERVMKTNTNYELVVKDIISHLFPPKAIQLQKKYLSRGLYKLHDTKIKDFVCKIDKIIEYLKKFPPFGALQCLPEYYILELVGCSLPKEWYK